MVFIRKKKKEKPEKDSEKFTRLAIYQLKNGDPDWGVKFAEKAAREKKKGN